MSTCRLVTRRSALALAQAELAAQALRAASPGETVTVVTGVTEGDRDTATPLSAMPGRGVFVGGLRAEVLAGRAEAAVHSLKDVPTAPVAGLVLAAVLPRGDVRDVLVSRTGAGLATLPPAARVGTSSTRRAALIAAARPDLHPVAIRGNVDTRLRKLRDGEVDAVVLAAAGMERLGRLAEVTEWLDADTFLPAPGQGAIALECRSADRATTELIAGVNHAETAACVIAERAFLAVQGANCSLPVGAYATVRGGLLHLRATLSGDPDRAGDASGPPEQAAAIGTELGRRLRDAAGADG